MGEISSKNDQSIRVRLYWYKEMTSTRLPRHNVSQLFFGVKKKETKDFPQHYVSIIITPGIYIFLTPEGCTMLLKQRIFLCNTYKLTLSFHK